MKNFQNDIDKLVSKILSEEIDSKVRKIMETKSEFDEELTGSQSKIDVAQPKGKITAADFKKLRDGKKSNKSEVEENIFKNMFGKKEDPEMARAAAQEKDRKENPSLSNLGYDYDDIRGWHMPEPGQGRFDRDNSNKKEVEEYFIDDEEEDAEELSQNEPTYVGRGLKDNKIISKLKNAIRSFNEEDMDNGYNSDDSDWQEIDLDNETDDTQLEESNMFSSFDDEHGWFDQHDREHSGDFDFDYDEEEFPDFDSFIEKHGRNQSWFHPKQGRKMFDMYQKEYGGKPFRVRTRKNDLEEDEATEGNAFSGARAKAIEDGEDNFEVDGKKYHVKGEKRMDESEDKWIQKTNMKKGGLHKALGIPEGNKIPKSKLNSIKKDLMSKAKGDKKLSAADSKLLKQVNMALTLGGLNESRNTLSLSENELIDMIEKIVKEEIVKDTAEKNSFSVNKPQGLKKTEKAQGESKKENDNYSKEVVKKMKDYMKDMYMGGKGYDENPDDFPQSNYDMEKEHNEMKYQPSDAVEEYIEAFSYPGMTNLVYDEIKPEDKRIGKQLKGDSTTGNAVTGKDGKALGNVSKRSEKVGDRFKKNFDENLYGAEQMKASYKRQPQETIEVEGNGKTKGSLKSKQQGADKSSSINKATKILNTLESTEAKATKIINEDLQKMKNLISYNRKTQ